MKFKRTSHEEKLKATSKEKIKHTEPFLYEALSFHNEKTSEDGEWDEISLPEDGDWLFHYPERVQPFNQYVNQTNLPTKVKNKFYLLPIGCFDESFAPKLEIIREFAEIFFQSPSILLPSLSLSPSSLSPVDIQILSFNDRDLDLFTVNNIKNYNDHRENNNNNFNKNKQNKNNKNNKNKNNNLNNNKINNNHNKNNEKINEIIKNKNKKWEIRSRITTKRKIQLHCDDLLQMLAEIKPKDAHCIMAITMIDLYPNEKWNFVFGIAEMSFGVSIFSFSRYSPFFNRSFISSKPITNELFLNEHFPFYYSFPPRFSFDNLIQNNNPNYNFNDNINNINNNDNNDKNIEISGNTKNTKNNKNKNKYLNNNNNNNNNNSNDKIMTKEEEKLMLKRSLSVMAHETGHMLNIEHCVYFQCIMNGANSLTESDKQPIYECPCCLRKFQFHLKFQTHKRYFELWDFYERFDFVEESIWVYKRLSRIYLDLIEREIDVSLYFPPLFQPFDFNEQNNENYDNNDDDDDDDDNDNHVNINNNKCIDENDENYDNDDNND